MTLIPAFQQMVTPEPNWFMEVNDPNFFLVPDSGHVHELCARARLLERLQVFW